jgi:N-acetylglucosamine kinase-like BadF-type ATPase
MAYFEEKSDVVQFCDMRSLKSKSSSLRIVTNLEKKGDALSKNMKKEPSANLLDIISVVIEDITVLMTSSNNGVIRMYEYYNDMFRPVSIFKKE